MRTFDLRAGAHYGLDDAFARTIDDFVYATTPAALGRLEAALLRAVPKSNIQRCRRAGCLAATPRGAAHTITTGEYAGTPRQRIRSNDSFLTEIYLFMNSSDRSMQVIDFGTG